MSKTVIDHVTGEQRPLKIALDFDGVLHAYTSGWTGPIPFDPPVPGAINFCEQLVMEGYDVSIFSTRVHPELGRGSRQKFISYSDKTLDGWAPSDELGPTLAEEGIRAWFKHWGFPAELHNCVITHKKLHAELFVDDRGYRFNGDFKEVLDYIEDTNPELETWVGRQ